MGSFRSGAALNQIQMAEWQWPDQPRFLICTPLSHAGAAFFVPTLLRGGCLVRAAVLRTRRSCSRPSRSTASTPTMLVPTMIYLLLDHPDFDDARPVEPRHALLRRVGDVPARLQEGIERLGQVFFQFYGQSECGMTISVLRKEEHLADDPERLASCGRPVPWLDVRLLDDDLREVPQGELGEICVRGPLVMKGYWKKPDETAEALRGGWLHTGDVARADKDGFLTIVDRKKDMIVTGGFNVFPREIEDAISSHPAVASVAVVGVPDQKWGEAVKACVVLRDGQTRDRGRTDREGPRGQGIRCTLPSPWTSSIRCRSRPLGKLDKKTLRASYR